MSRDYLNAQQAVQHMAAQGFIHSDKYVLENSNRTAEEQ